MKLSVIWILIFISSNVYGFDQKDRMMRYLQSVEGVFQSSYAMKEWKEEHLNWNMDEQFQNMYTAVNSGTVKNGNDFHKLLDDYINSASDWHVNIGFARTARSTLPLSVRSADSRYFIVWIDRVKLPKDQFDFEVGDEVISIDGKSLQELTDQLANSMGDKNNLTVKAFAEMALTNRKGFFESDFPKGSSVLAIKKKSEEYKTEHQTQLTWSYTPEVVTGYNDKSISLFFNPFNIIKNTSKYLKRNLYISADSLTKQKNSENNFGLGRKNSFLPKFGKIIWEAEKDNYYQAYIYKSESGKFYGYFRIKDYMPYDQNDLSSKKPFTDLEKIITHFIEFTDGLVIDQLNNPGGDIFYGYFIASMLTKNVIETIPEQEMLSPLTYLDAVSSLEQFNKVKTVEDMEKVFGKDVVFGGIKPTLDTLEMMKGYYRNIVEDYQQGLAKTRLQAPSGINHIRPHSSINYSKPVVVLINELDISAGDFFPALIQDNGIATLFGTNTSGAGGYIIGNQFPNSLGVMGFTVTGSIAYRKDGKPIEDLGIKPDVEYAMKVEDYTDNFKSYIKAVNTILDSK